MDVAELLKEHCQSYCTLDEEDEERITVRRSHIWEDTVRTLKRNIDLRKTIKITFLGEPGIDDGGPRREYLRLLMKEISEQSLLTGPPLCKVLTHNTLAMQKKLYRYIGEAIVMSVTQGGPGPMCFASSVVDYLQGGIERVRPRLDDVPNEMVKELLRKVSYIDAFIYVHVYCETVSPFMPIH